MNAGTHPRVRGAALLLVLWLLAMLTAVIASFALFDALGISLNIMTLGGLALGIGMLIDNTIVVTENIFHDNRFSGFVDCLRCGVADKYQDLAIASRNIESVFGREFSGLFFDAYGESRPDEEKLDYYRLLDEFF